MNSKERSDASSTRYPADWESIGATRDQVPYRIRPIRGDDEQRELDFIERLSPESRYNRLLVGFRTPTAEQLARWVHVDYQNQMAMVATIGSDADERIIGVARYSLDAPRRCEFAIAIADEWQRRGIGSRLSQLVIEYARSRGMQELHAVMLSTNRPMIGLAQAMGMAIHLDTRDARLITGSLSLTPPSDQIDSR